MSAPPPVRAAGLIICRFVEHFQYLLLQTSYGIHHWTPPKGHLDPGEDAITAACRETEEEAGLSKDTYKIFEGSNFPLVLEYPVKNKPKKVEYWLGQLINPNTPIKLSDEHQDYRWVDLAQAKELTHDNFHAILDTVENYLKQNGKK